MEFEDGTCIDIPCIGDQNHTISQGNICPYWGEVGMAQRTCTEGGWIENEVCTDLGSGGGGSSGGGGGGSSSGSNNNDDDEDPEPEGPIVVIPTDPDVINLNHRHNCQELSKLLQDYAVNGTPMSPLDAIVSLQNNLSSTFEQGFSLVNVSNSYMATPVQQTGPDYVVYRQAANVFGGMHLHQNNGKAYPMFSGPDVLNLLEFYNQYNDGSPTAENLPAVVLVTFQGVYAIKIEDLAALQALQPILDDYDDDDNDNNDKYEKFVEIFNKRYSKHNTNNGGGEPVINGGPNEYQNELLKIFNDYDGNGTSLGISLYKANQDLTGWTKLSLNPITLSFGSLPPVEKPCSN